ncbi:hypothetical protein OAS67_09055 [Alphaproteobacteria bacterium]|nr:hypothetical protein [Alphaproteobacteria bacterium]
MLGNKPKYRIAHAVLPWEVVLFTRSVTGKRLGLAAGLAGFICLPFFMPEEDLFLRWRLLLWYTTFAAIIAMFGVITWHPILKILTPCWVRGPYWGVG